MQVSWRNLRTLTALVFSLSVLSSSPALQRFDSPSGFSVMYPATWFRIGTLGDRLNLLSSKKGAEGVVIQSGQAEIIVMEAQGPHAATLKELIKHYSEGASVLSQNAVPNPDAGKRGCSELNEVVSKEEIVPSSDTPIPVPYVINTDFFCEVGERKFVTLLRNRQGDKQQAHYQRVALEVMRSLRVLH